MPAVSTEKCHSWITCVLKYQLWIQASTILRSYMGAFTISVFFFKSERIFHLIYSVTFAQLAAAPKTKPGIHIELTVE